MPCSYWSDRPLRAPNNRVDGRELVFLPGPAASAKSRIEAILDGLRTAGYRELDQIEVASRSAEGDPSRLPILARELIGLDPQIVVAVSTAAARSLQAAGATMPIVAHDLETRPVASGLIESYARPGGAVTGFSRFPGDQSEMA